MLAPIFDDAADKVAAEFPESGQVVMGKVDCDREGMDVHVEHQVTYVTVQLDCHNGLFNFSCLF
jgi:endoplasmic reticulum resident protein 44